MVKDREMDDVERQLLILLKLFLSFKAKAREREVKKYLLMAY
jgi:hypothetical protein